jgi:glycosyltransferase involved in cell wall biosynthesis
LNEKIALVDHSFHRRTNSTSFLIEILKKHFHVDVIWDNAWQEGPHTDLKYLKNKGYKKIILFQQIYYGKKELREIDGVNLIIIPMYDCCSSCSYRFWQKFRYVKVINFSRALHLKLKKYRFMSKYFQYFPNTSNSVLSPLTGDSLSGFFWQRTDRITWKHIKVLIKETRFKRFYIHTAVDPPGYSLILPSEKEKNKYNITLTNWFPKRKDYLKTLAKTDVYFAPRSHEGIGMSFLEAMAMGKCVVAPNNPTMNEYIVHGKTGLLYDPNRPKPLDFSDVKRIGMNARDYMENGYKEWLEAEAELIDFIKLPLEKGIHNILHLRNAPFLIYGKEIIKKRFPLLARVLIKAKKFLFG